MKQTALVKFKLNDFVEDIQDVMANKRFRDFPIEDEEGRYIGMISRRNIIKAGKKRLYLSTIMRSHRLYLVLRMRIY